MQKILGDPARFIAAVLMALWFSPAFCQEEAPVEGANPAVGEEDRGAGPDPKKTAAALDQPAEEENFLFEGIEIPAPPADDYPVADYAELLSKKEEEDLHRVQLACFHEYDTPLVVVTIYAMREYGPADWSIERFAYSWFNKWAIGKRGPGGELINRGILLIVSLHDRKARIELGADWGRDWDAHCSVIMNSKIVPRFKKDDYAGGIKAGVEALARMAGTPPGERAPVRSSGKGYHRGRPSHSSGQRLPTLPTALVVLVVFVGIVLIGLSFKAKEHRKELLLAGVALVALGLLTYLLIFALVLYFGRGSGGGGGGGGDGGWSGGGGGFGGGGFSGGGGASGSW